MTTQSESEPFVEAISRFHRPGLYAAQMLKLSDKMTEEMCTLLIDILVGSLNARELRSSDTAHLVEALEDVRAYTDALHAQLREVSQLVTFVTEAIPQQPE